MDRKTLCAREGDYFGQPFRLRPWQKRFLYRLYELDERGRRRYRNAVLGLPKGNGKTPLAGAIAAPSSVVASTSAPTVIVAAASLKQADLVFGDLRTMCKESPTLAAITEPLDLEILLRTRLSAPNEGQQRQASTTARAPPA